MNTKFNRKIRVFIVALASVFLCQCSDKEGLSKDVEISPLTKNPLIRMGKRKVGSGEVQPQWFDFTFNINNASAYDIRIEEVLFFVSADGIEYPPKFFDLGLLTVVNSNGTQYTYSSYCNYKPGYNSMVRACRDFTVYANVADTGNTSNSKELNFYIGDIPASESGTRAYQVRMEVYGVIIDPNTGTDVERLLKRLYFTTR